MRIVYKLHTLLKCWTTRTHTAVLTRPIISAVVASARNRPHGPGTTGRNPALACIPLKMHRPDSTSYA